MLGLASLIILLIMKWMSRKISSPTVKAEILGWKLDVAYSLGMSLAFFIAVQLQNTSLGFLSPYFDQIIAIVVMIFMVPETIKILHSENFSCFLRNRRQLTESKKSPEKSWKTIPLHPFSMIFPEQDERCGYPFTSRLKWIPYV